MLVSVVMVVGLQTFVGNTGLLSFGHMTFVGLGAYIAALLMIPPAVKAMVTPGLPPLVAGAELHGWQAAPIAILATGLVALPCALLMRRLAGPVGAPKQAGQRSPVALLGLFALLMTSNVVFSGWAGVTNGPGGLAGIARDTTLTFALVAAILAIMGARIFKESSWGLQLRASRDDELAAAAVGVRVRRLQLAALVLSAMISALGGELLAGRLTAITPDNFFLAQAFLVVAMLLLGGMGSVSGAVVGAISITVIQYTALGFEGTELAIGPLHINQLLGLSQLSVTVTILLIMAVRRQGIFGDSEIEDAFPLLNRLVRGGFAVVLARRAIVEKREPATGPDGEDGGAGVASPNSAFHGIAEVLGGDRPEPK